jgi:hypothetical protein
MWLTMLSTQQLGAIHNSLLTYPDSELWQSAITSARAEQHEHSCAVPATMDHAPT